MTRTSLDDGARLMRYLGSVVRASARAARAAKAAERHEAMLGNGMPALRAFHESQVALHRQTEERHLAAMALYSRHACLAGQRITKQVEEPGVVEKPRLIDTLVDVTGSAGVWVGLQSRVGADAVIASNAAALAAHKCEILLGEGPGNASMVEGPLLISEDEMQRRWSGYAAAVHPLGVQAVASVPLRACDLTLGSLTTFGTSVQPIEAPLNQLCTIGDAVVEVMMDEVADPIRDGQGLIEAVDHLDVVHQAAGMVSVQFGCSTSDALALLRAHAYVSETDLQSAAQEVIAGDLRFER